jgi:transposase
MRDNEFTRILNWPGYRVFRHEIDETAKTLRLWVRRKRGTRKLIYSGCGRKFTDAHDYYQREVRYFGKQMKFITVVSNLETGEPLWFGQDRKQETLDEFFQA